MFKIYRAIVIVLTVVLACVVAWAYFAGHNSDAVFTALWITTSAAFVAVMLSIKE